MRLHYETDVIREKVAGEPFLLPGEELKYQAKIGIPASMVFWSIMALFLPPFLIWGVLLFGIAAYSRRVDGVWVTNQRVVYYTKFPFSKSYNVQSVPLAQIAKVRLAPIASEFPASVLDRLLGVGDLQVFVHDSSWAQLSMVDIKKPKELMRALQALIAERVEAA